MRDLHGLWKGFLGIKDFRGSLCLRSWLIWWNSHTVKGNALKGLGSREILHRGFRVSRTARRGQKGRGVGRVYWTVLEPILAGLTTLSAFIALVPQTWVSCLRNLNSRMIGLYIVLTYLIGTSAWLSSWCHEVGWHAGLHWLLVVLKPSDMTVFHSLIKSLTVQQQGRPTPRKMNLA